MGTVRLPLLASSAIFAASGLLDVDDVEDDALAVSVALQPVAVAHHGVLYIVNVLDI